MSLLESGDKVTLLILVSISSKQIPQNNAGYINYTKMFMRPLWQVQVILILRILWISILIFQMHLSIILYIFHWYLMLFYFNLEYISKKKMILAWEQRGWINIMICT